MNIADAPNLPNRSPEPNVNTEPSTEKAER